ncbi:MAG: hypothetical protein A1D16_08455 [Flavihumibacter sp. CACIAM 22H1]|nr:MAG: hypothetical protein A1D16_08455 [Flavihumibacter sp. CACIAM 22H1]
MGEEYYSWFKKVKESVLVEYASLIKTFETDLEAYDLEGCKIIYPDKAGRIGKTFNLINSTMKTNFFPSIVPM